MSLRREVGQAKFHILIPSYGNPELLTETLRSLVRSVGREIREGVVLATCVDDASPEALESVVQLSGEGLVEYVRNDTNLGIIPNFNHCITLARAPFVVFLGADDLLLPSYLPSVEEMIQKRPGAAVYAPGVAEINSLGRRSRSLSYLIKKAISPFSAGFRTVDLSGSRLATRLAVGDFLYFPSLCWETEELRRLPFDPQWSDAADWHRLFQCAVDGRHLVVDSRKAVFLYRRHARSASEISAGQGVRFGVERALSLQMSGMAQEKGWWIAGMVGRLHPIVRMNALSRRLSNLF